MNILKLISQQRIGVGPLSADVSRAGEHTQMSPAVPSDRPISYWPHIRKLSNGFRDHKHHN